MRRDTGMTDERALVRGFFTTAKGEPPQGWERGFVTLTLRDPEGQLPIEAWRWGPFAVHENCRGWRLTHAHSGLLIWTFDTAELAVECADRIAALADFDAIKERIPAGTDLYPKVQKVIDEIEHRDMH
jgi:hypothetical protein